MLLKEGAWTSKENDMEGSDFKSFFSVKDFSAMANSGGFISERYGAG